MENHSAHYMQVALETEDLSANLLSQSKPYMENVSKKRDEIILTSNSKGGLANPRAFLFLILWYIFSGCTLFLNKYILSYMEGDPTILGNTELNSVILFIQSIQ